MEEKLFLDYPHGKLCALHEPASPTDIVILGHGLASSKSTRSHQALRPLLHADGIATMAIDFYAHGESSGTFETLTVTKALDGFKRAYQFVREQGYRRIILVGSSFSGVVAMAAAAELDVHGILLKCPVFDYRKLWLDRLGEAGLLTWSQKGTMEIWKKQLGYGFYEDALGYDMPEIAQCIRAPAMIIHGDADTHVPLWHPQQACHFLGGKKTLHVIPGADHFFKEVPHFKELVSVAHLWLRDIFHSR